MITCATNRSGWDYYDYGCWCGYGGSGTPIDDTDRYVHLLSTAVDLAFHSMPFITNLPSKGTLLVSSLQDTKPRFSKPRTVPSYKFREPL